MREIERISNTYRTFAEVEARGRSPLYAEIAHAIARDEEVLAWLSKLPPAKQQPNLFLAAVKYLCGTAESWENFRALFKAHQGEISAVMMARRTQTNEAARCATLLPILARLPQPLALIEVGAAAGLCLLPDRYSYEFNGQPLSPAAAASDAPVLSCAANAAVPIPKEAPRISWRAGLDLSPIDPNNPEEARWLEALVWPGEGARLDTLRAALRIAAKDPPRIVKGDLCTDLPALAKEAPEDATLVVFHTAVLNYVFPQEDREAFVRTVKDFDATWIANEGLGVFPKIAERAPYPRSPAKMLQSVNANPLAWADPHGTTLDWFAEPSSTWA